MSTCSGVENPNAAAPIAGSLSYHTLITYITAGATVCTWIICGLLALAHLFRYTDPSKQRQIIRLIWTPAVFAFFAVLGVWKYDAANYLTPIAEIYECLALVALFFLLLAHVGPASFEEQLSFFSQHSGSGRGANAPAGWFRKTWISVVQVLPTRVITVIATIIVEATHCTGSKSYHRAFTIINVVQGFLTAICLVSIMRFYLRFRTEIHASDRRIVWKMATFKGIVFIQLLQRIILNALSQNNALKPTTHLSYNDLNLGLNSVLTCFEAFLFSVLFVWPYWPSRSSSSAVGTKRIGFFAALLDSVNFKDILVGILRAVQLFQNRNLPSANADRTWYTQGTSNEYHMNQRAKPTTTNAY